MKKTCIQLVIISLLVGATNAFATGSKEEREPVIGNITLANNPISQAMSKLVKEETQKALVKGLTRGAVKG
ncbi:MAG TPA: hypothetical protein VJ869_07495 [Sphaerochaeta sp.]|nr:hypothetical protein [Sphaerochaeta sp.]